MTTQSLIARRGLLHRAYADKLQRACMSILIAAIASACTRSLPAPSPLPKQETAIASSAPATTPTSAARPLDLQPLGVYPETVVYDSRKHQLLFGSMRNGGVFALTATGQSTQLVNDVRLRSVLGIAIDQLHHRLLVLTSDLGVSVRTVTAEQRKFAAVGIYDLHSGRPIDFVNLSNLKPENPHLANGIAVDSMGNAYISDSFSPIIYRVDMGGHPEIMVEDERFIGNGINLNGVVVHPDGYLIVAHKSKGVLFKIPLHSPHQVSEIDIAATLPGADGLLLTDSRSLVLVANEVDTDKTNAAFVLSSKDDWKTAQIDKREPLGDVYPTTAVVVDEQIYVLHSQLKRLLAGAANADEQAQQQATLTPIGVNAGMSTADARLPSAFVYGELQLPYTKVPWPELSKRFTNQRGLRSITWLASVDQGSIGGLYEFERMDDAQLFVTRDFPAWARDLGVAQTTRMFDGKLTADASRAMNSVYYGGRLSTPPGAFVYTEVQMSVTFEHVPWQVRNPLIRANPGFLAKTWLSGLDTHTVGGLYAFDTVEHATRFATTFFADSAAKQGKAYTTRVFDAQVTAAPNQASDSPFFR